MDEVAERGIGGKGRERERVVVSGALVRKRAPIIYVDVSGAREKALGIAAERVLAELRGG